MQLAQRVKHQHGTALTNLVIRPGGVRETLATMFAQSCLYCCRLCPRLEPGVAIFVYFLRLIYQICLPLRRLPVFVVLVLCPQMRPTSRDAKCAPALASAKSLLPSVPPTLRKLGVGLGEAGAVIICNTQSPVYSQLLGHVAPAATTTN